MNSSIPSPSDFLPPLSLNQTLPSSLTEEFELMNTTAEALNFSSTTARSLTFLDLADGQQPNDTVGFILAFSILSFASFISVVQGLYETSRKHYLYGRYSLKILFPWASFVQVLENATLAYDVAGRAVVPAWAGIVYVLQATVPPSLLLSTFDVTYSIHKTRNIQFCGVYDGHTRSKNPIRAMLLKVAMRTMAMGMLAIGLLVNFNWITPSNTLAGRVGWYYFVTTPWQDDSLHVLLGVLPIGLAAICSFYFSIALWRYGTVYSIVVHASPFNPWFSPFFGTLALVGGQWVGTRWYPLLSNLGIFVFVESILLLFMEVNKDMEAATELRNFLSVIGGKQNEEYEQQQQQRHTREPRVISSKRRSTKRQPSKDLFENESESNGKKISVVEEEADEFEEDGKEEEEHNGVELELGSWKPDSPLSSKPVFSPTKAEFT